MWQPRPPPSFSQPPPTSYSVDRDPQLTSPTQLVCVHYYCDYSSKNMSANTIECAVMCVHLCWRTGNIIPQNRIFKEDERGNKQTNKKTTPNLKTLFRHLIFSHRSFHSATHRFTPDLHLLGSASSGRNSTTVRDTYHYVTSVHYCVPFSTHTVLFLHFIGGKYRIHRSLIIWNAFLKLIKTKEPESKQQQQQQTTK